ncbi:MULTISPECIES: hypothetical protein [unclassified Clostridium]|uniref:hypothetical protein n=1 Tax=unclassified Clostridium TaxID=2614128 RepID=UPI001EEB40C2|nr:MULTISPECIES: hypothetical protein [unclassified Clostridium]
MEFFSYDNYRQILDLLKQSGNIYKFNEFMGKTGILLRHDVDFDIYRAYELSKMEKEKDVKSTYFILTNCDYYNIASMKNRVILKEMSNNGFEIGIHFDPTIYGDINLCEMSRKVDFECSMIEDITGEKVKSISLHNPSIHNQYPIFNGYINTYSKEYFNTEYYFSDSCMNFRGKNIMELASKADQHMIQVLFHPIHFSESGQKYTDIFKNIIVSKINEFDTFMRGNRTYKNDIGSNNLYDFIRSGDLNE